MKTPRPNASGPQPIFSRLVDVDRLDEQPMRIDIAADAGACAALAAQNALPSLAMLRAELTLQRIAGSRVAVTGTLAAHLERTCVVSLEPFAVEINEPVAMEFAPETQVRAAEERWVRRDEDEDDDQVDEPPDPIVNGKIDIGAALAELFALALDPYPRKPGISFVPATPTPAPEKPFAALSRLKRDREGG